MLVLRVTELNSMEQAVRPTMSMSTIKHSIYAYPLLALGQYPSMPWRCKCLLRYVLNVATISRPQLSSGWKINPQIPSNITKSHIKPSLCSQTCHGEKLLNIYTICAPHHLVYFISPHVANLNESTQNSPISPHKQNIPSRQTDETPLHLLQSTTSWYRSAALSAPISKMHGFAG